MGCASSPVPTVCPPYPAPPSVLMEKPPTLNLLAPIQRNNQYLYRNGLQKYLKPIGNLLEPLDDNSKHELSHELIQKITHGDLAEIISLCAALNEWCYSGKTPSFALQFQYTQLVCLLAIRLDLLQTHQGYKIFPYLNKMSFFIRKAFFGLVSPAPTNSTYCSLQSNIHLNMFLVGIITNILSS